MSCREIPGCDLKVPCLEDNTSGTIRAHSNSRSNEHSAATASF